MNTLTRADHGKYLSDAECRELAAIEDLSRLTAIARNLRDHAHGKVISYSRKVFIPLTQLCRDVCHYCTFAQPPRRMTKAYLSLTEVAAIAAAGAASGCTEALFTLGDKPELRYSAARTALDSVGHGSTLSYLREAAEHVLKTTGLLPHLNPGTMDAADYALLRPVSASMGLMLEGVAQHLERRGGAHYGSPDKSVAARVETIRQAGAAKIPFTSGLLIGLGENRSERIEAMLVLRDLHRQYGHIQEIIIQNFRAKPGTKMAGAAEPSFEEHLWTIAVARLIFGPSMNIQAPPNLSEGPLTALIEAGINDWGGVSPITPDHVNPEAAWPHLADLETQTEAAGKSLVQRLPVYPAHMERLREWADPAIASRLCAASDAFGWARACSWSPGQHVDTPPSARPVSVMRSLHAESPVQHVLARAEAGERLAEDDIVMLFGARGHDFAATCQLADKLRRQANGDTVSYVIVRNINYTNICSYRCTFCAFSKGKTHAHLRGAPYRLQLDEVQRRAIEAWNRGATEVCMQGGIHPDYTGDTYLELCAAVKAACPSMHIHAFSPLEVTHGARTLGITIPEFLARLKDAGLGSLPGTAAEILDDEVRAIICPDKLTTQEWLDVVESAHRVGLKTTSTIMFGHVDHPRHWARHLIRLRELQRRTGGITEFVPLPFVHMEAPMNLRGQSRKGPTFRETILMHAVARIVFHGLIDNIQASWVKLGEHGIPAVLKAGVNDLGGTLMNESISRAAGAGFGEEFPPESMEALIREAGRIPRQRTTLYANASEERRQASLNAPELSAIPKMTA